MDIIALVNPFIVFPIKVIPPFFSALFHSESIKSSKKEVGEKFVSLLTTLL